MTRIARGTSTGHGRRNRLPHHCTRSSRSGGAGDFACESRFAEALRQLDAEVAAEARQ